MNSLPTGRYDAHAKQWLIAIKDGKQENQETLQQLTKDITTLYRRFSFLVVQRAYVFVDVCLLVYLSILDHAFPSGLISPRSGVF